MADEQKVDLLKEYQNEHEAAEAAESNAEANEAPARDEKWFFEIIEKLPPDVKERWESFYYDDEEQALYEADYFNEYMCALVGFSDRGNGIYSYNKCIQCLIDSYTEQDIRTCNPGKYEDGVPIPEDELADEKFEMATEWFGRNPLQALPYEYEKAPIIMYNFPVDD